MRAELASRYDPKEAESRWYEFWEKSGYFHAEPPAGVPPSGGREEPANAGTPTTPYTIVIPPPNVTGALHMGHALNNTLQDILIRWRRMQGYNTLWVPGTDHAGIATQAVVEKRIREQEGKTRRDLGRDELVRRIWAWKDDYERRILNQLRKLGCSCDWQRTRFTFDEGCSRAVRETFFKMFKDGLIYRGKRLVNWDTQLQTSVADDETYTEEVKSGFWTFKYAVKEGSGFGVQGSGQTCPDCGKPMVLRYGKSGPFFGCSGFPECHHTEPVTADLAQKSGPQPSTINPQPEYVRFSTTRPETMLGDTAVAVHPNDPRYRHLIGKTVTIPLVGREIPIIADGMLVDPELGTGCVKVTPAHDPNDYACWQRHQGKPDEIGIINILNPDGTINENGGPYAGLDRYVARERVTVDMERLGLYEGCEDRMIPLKFSDRSKTPIEPLLSDQWFVRMGDREGGEPPLPLGEGWGEGSSGAASSPDALTLALSQGERGPAFGFAEIAMAAVRDGRVKIHPERYAKTYLDWLGEKRDWCISRQLWWGHRIPVWTRAASTNLMQTLYRLSTNHPDMIAFKPGASTTREDRETSLDMVCLRDDEPSLIQSLGQLGFVQDPDVLDTWFSSQLWPHSTLGWPERTRELEFYYPTSVLVTSRDIITLWVARMVIAGRYNCGDVPFRDVYITPKILDGFGQTMSKSKGNGVDPLDIIDKYGADALRFGIATMTTESQDARLPVGYECPFCQTYIAQKIEHQQMKPKALKPVPPATGESEVRGLVKPRIKCPSCKKDFQFSSPNFDPDPGEPVARVVSERFEQGRNFANKLWNAARFVLMNLEDYAPRTATLEELTDEEGWILNMLQMTIAEVTSHLEKFEFSEAAKAIYEFAWNDFCDWYVEMSKIRLRDPKRRSICQQVLVTVLDDILRVLHPMMPFITEHIWQELLRLAPERANLAEQSLRSRLSERSVMVAAWPSSFSAFRIPQVDIRTIRLQYVIYGIRNIRSTLNVDQKSRVAAHVRCSAEIAAELTAARPFIEQLANVDKFVAGPEVPKPADSVSSVAADWELYVPLTGLIDRAAEIERNRKLLESVTAQHKSFQAKLANADFVAKAPPDVVELHRQRERELQAQRASIEEILRELGG